MVEYTFKSGAPPRGTKRLIAMLKSGWDNKQTW